MKVSIECERCGTKVELTPMTVGQHAYLHRKLIKKKMYVFETNMRLEISPNLYMDFVDKLTQSRTDEETKEILENNIEYNIDTEGQLEEVRIDCRGCGDYIVLTEFGN
ncbi:hypothetical protein [Paenibacillus sp. SN-8-1]|uniref:hypothetical protein n=1 Tax=Paenibacillus sp. SN-8-1 TaxID=3435409 RepID=UPI003D9A91D4